MRFGPSSLRSSRILAKGLNRPKLRSDLRISKQNITGETSYVVKIEETSSYRRYGEYEFNLLEACDGTRTPAELSEYMSAKHPDQPVGEAEVLDFLDGIEPAMWERSLGEKNLAILERLRDERKGRLDQSSLLYITFKAWDPNKTLERIDPYLGWIYTRGFVIFSVALSIVAIWLLAGDWSRISRDTLDMWNFSDKSAYDIWMFWIVLFVLTAIHEFGHGLTCKHYGGDVPQMGFMLIYLTPAFFTDTTDILLFDRIAPRELTIFAGIWIELVICGLSAVAWYFTLPGSFWNGLAYKVLILSGIQGALINLNPLIKADGYYALSQYLRVDNLREDAFAFLRAWILKYLFRRDIELPVVSRRLRRIFLSFSLAAAAYSTTLILVVLLWVKNIFVNKLGDWGYFLFALLLYFFVQKKLRKAWPSIRAWYEERKEEIMAWKLTRRQTIGFAAIVLIVSVPPIPSKVSSNFVLEPLRQAEVRATVPGVVKRVFAREGDEVTEGQVLAVLENPEIREQATVTAQNLTIEQSLVRSAEAASDSTALTKASQQVRKLENDLQIAQQKLDQLEIRAPIDGIVTTPELPETLSSHYAEGELFCHLSNRKEMRVRILVRDWQLEQVRVGARVDLKVASYPLRTFSGRVDQILPAAALDQPVSNPAKLTLYGQELTNYIAVIAYIPNRNGSLREGMTGTAKIFGPPRPLVWQWGRDGWRWLRSQFW